MRFSARRGAKWLDKNEPGWADRIDLGRLDMTTDSNCVLGQLYGYPGASGMAASMGIYRGFFAKEKHWIPLIEARKTFPSTTPRWYDVR